MQDSDQVDYARITSILLKMADWLEDFGFSAPRHDLEEPRTQLNQSVMNPRTENDLAVINKFMNDLMTDIFGELQVAPTPQLQKAQIIVSEAAKALGQCVERY